LKLLASLRLRQAARSLIVRWCCQCRIKASHTSRQSGQIIQGNAEAKALLFGRCQNRLLAGNRNGASVQVHPSKLPEAPFKPFYLTIGNLAVQYRANALNWAFSSDGIVASMDALCWGVAGGTGTPWVPVAPGVTTFHAAACS